jgi:hypothetical protein
MTKEQIHMSRKRAFSLLISTLLMLTFASSVLAQPFEVLVGVQDNRLVMLDENGAAAIIAQGARSYGELVVSPDGTYLAFAAYDENFARALNVYDRTTGETIPIAVGVSSGIPFSFTQANELVYAMDGEIVAGGEGGGVMRLQVFIQPLPKTEAPSIILVEFGVGCGGGSPLPIDQIYSSETYSLGGNHLILALTPFGLVYSTDCQGINLAVRSLDGQSLSTFDGMSRAVLSMDETRIAAIPFVQGETTPLVVRILDLTTKAVADIPVDATPDQLAWNATGSGVYYSVRAFDTQINFEGDERARLDAVLGEGIRLEQWAVSLSEVNVTSDPGRISLIYNGDGFAIGRMANGDGSVYISVVPNIDTWANAVADGTFDPYTATEAEANALTPVTVWGAAFNGDNIEISPIANDLRSFAVMVPRG